MIETKSTFEDLAKEDNHGLMVHTHIFPSINCKEQTPVYMLKHFRLATFEFPVKTIKIDFKN